MPEKFDPDSSPGVKLLRAFRKLLLNDHKHFQADLAQELNCSPQTVIRIMNDIEQVIGANLESGMDERRKWYRIVSNNPLALGLKSEELRYLSVCRDLAFATLPEEIISKVDDAIFNLSLRLSEKERKDRTGKTLIRFFNKGRIDYRGYYPILEKIFAASAKGQICRILYKALGNEEARWHYFVPHKVASMNQALYFSGATIKENLTEVDHKMTLALHRIKEINFLDKYLNIDFDRLNVEAFGMPWHEPQAASVHFREGKGAEYVSERIWSAPQHMEWLPDGSLRLGLVINSVPEFEAWVRSFGENVLDYNSNSDEFAYLLTAEEKSLC